MERKLNYFNEHIHLPEDTLAKQILNIQIKNGIPGLFKECMEMIRDLKLPDVTEQKITKISWKWLVKKAILEKNENELRKDLEGSKKAKEFRNEPFEIKSYFTELNLIEARVIFKQRFKMMRYIKTLVGV